MLSLNTWSIRLVMKQALTHCLQVCRQSAQRPSLPLVSAAAITLPMTASPVRPAQPSRKKLAATGQSASTQVATSSNNPGTLNRALSEGIQNLLNNFTPNNVTTCLKLKNAHDLFFNYYTTASDKKKYYSLRSAQILSKLDLLIDCLDKNEALYNLFSPSTFYKNDLFDNNTQCPTGNIVFFTRCAKTPKIIRLSQNQTYFADNHIKIQLDSL